MSELGVVVVVAVVGARRIESELRVRFLFVGVLEDGTRKDSGSKLPPGVNDTLSMES